MKKTLHLVGKDIARDADALQLDDYTIQHAYQLTGTRDGGTAMQLEAEDDHIVEMRFDDDSFWMGTIGELPQILQTGTPPESRGFSNGGIEIPQVISFGSDTRGVFRNVILKTLQVLKPKGNIVAAIVKKSAEKLDEHLQEAPGLYYVDKDFRTSKVTQQIKDSAQPYLLFIHGTISTLDKSFDKMLSNPQYGLWAGLKEQYGDRMLALQHYTLTKSPFDNVLDILKWLPEKITLHVISTSRGGYVGEILSKYCDPVNPGFQDVHRALLENDFGKQVFDDLDKEAGKRKISIEKYVRVACPGAGSSLCSKRLDRFFNVLINGIQLATGGASSAFLKVSKKLLADVLACKARPDILPGIVPMNPESNFIKVLNHPSEEITTSLHVIAGNNKLSLKPKAFVTILMRLIFYGKNDWMVDTKSMSRGFFRKQNIGYFIDEGEEVNHFHYFANRDTQEAIHRAISAPVNTIAAGFESFDRRLPANADRGWIMGNLKPEEVSGNKPVIVFLPGILGSNLSKDNEEIYLDFGQILLGRMMQLDIQARNVKPTSLIKKFYGKFKHAFSDDYDVAVFPYDWRLSIAHEASRLNDYITHILGKTGNRSIKLVAHSMGGLVVRSFIQHHADTWKKVTERPEYKVLFLGSPLGGSYLIPEIFVGSGQRIKQMAGADLFHNKRQLLEVFNKYEGLISLLPLDNTKHDFSDPKTWNEMHDGYRSFNWPVPEAASIQAYADFRKEVLQFDTSVFKDKNFIYVAGKSDRTTNGFYYKEYSGDADTLTFTATPFGDGSVTWDTGIPAEIAEDGRVYYVRIGHGDLANEPDVFDGYKELLLSGKTGKLSKNKPTYRGEDMVTEIQDEVPDDISEDNFINTMVGSTGPSAPEKDSAPPITIILKCGDLKYATHPIMVGHLKSDGIMSAEKVLDYYFDNLLSKRLSTGNYPGNIGESKYFDHPNGKPMGALIVGMGKTEKLSGFQLEETVKQGVIEYLCTFKISDNNGKASISLSSLLLGCGYAGLSVETAIKAIISGVLKANATVRESGENVWPTIDLIEFIEINEDRALQALISLDMLKRSTNAGFYFEPKMQKILGSRKRLLFESNADWWQRVTIEDDVEYDKDGHKTRVFTFSSSMGTAREEVRKLYCSKQMIDSLMHEISTRDIWDTELAKTLFELLIPNDFKLAVRNQQNLLLILDKTTAAYPWEMLQDISVQSEPLSISAGMVRQLSTDDFTPNVNYTLSNTALVIGNPDTGNFLPSLPGAAEEAEAVNKIFSNAGYETTWSDSETSSAIIKKLFRSDYKIIHLAGHGVYHVNRPDESGMVIGNNIYLTTAEIRQLSFVPELVFINCCHLGNMDALSEEAAHYRYKLAANLGTQLIEMGVKVVIAAGWAINDMAAKEFTSDFYTAMISGSNFGDAVRLARKNCYDRHPYSNTWGAYQCYGDQFFTLRKNQAGAKPSLHTYYSVEQVKLDLDNLINRIGANYSDKQKEIYLYEANLIMDSASAANISAHTLYESLAILYRRLGDARKSIEHFKLFFEKDSSEFNVNSYVEYSRLLVEQYADDKNAIRNIQDVIGDLERLRSVIPAHAISNALGTAHKTMAYLRKDDARQKSIIAAVDAYIEAYMLGKNAGVDNTMYALSNAYILSLALQKKPDDLPDVTELEWAFEHITSFDNMLTFWDIMDTPRYWLCKFMMQQRGYVFPKGNAPVRVEVVIKNWKDIVRATGMESQQQVIIGKLRSLFSLFDAPRYKKLQADLKKILEALE